MYDMSMADRHEARFEVFSGHGRMLLRFVVAQSAEKDMLAAISFEQAIVKYGIAKAEYAVHPHRSVCRHQIRIETGEVVFAPISSISRSAPCKSRDAGGTWAARRLAGFCRRRQRDDINQRRSPNLGERGGYDDRRPRWRQHPGMSAHTADSGALKWYAPKDLSDYTGARMDIKRAVGATAVLSLHTDDGTWKSMRQPVRCGFGYRRQRFQPLA